MPQNVVFVGVCLVAVLAADARGACASRASPPSQDKAPPKVVFSTPSPSEIVHIDGSRNPEMIPQWRAWWYAFVVMSGGLKQVPSDVLEHLSDKEETSLLKAAEEDQQNYALCEARVMKLAPLLQTDAAKTINEKTREINLDCRRQTLQLRDSVLEGFSPEAQTALKQWVESNKRHMKESVPKKELAFYRQPE
jgi:hypothetical protein